AIGGDLPRAAAREPIDLERAQAQARGQGTRAAGAQGEREVRADGEGRSAGAAPVGKREHGAERAALTDRRAGGGAGPSPGRLAHRGRSPRGRLAVSAGRGRYRNEGAGVSVGVADARL